MTENVKNKNGCVPMGANFDLANTNLNPLDINSDGVVLPNSSVPGDFGDEFVARPNVVPELGRWYCYEFMVKANTPGERDGRIACWLDGDPRVTNSTIE